MIKHTFQYSLYKAVSNNGTSVPFLRRKSRNFGPLNLITLLLPYADDTGCKPRRETRQKSPTARTRQRLAQTVNLYVKMLFIRDEMCEGPNNDNNVHVLGSPHASRDRSRVYGDSTSFSLAGHSRLRIPEFIARRQFPRALLR